MTDKKEEATLNIYQKLAKVQAELKAPKNQYNAFGKYAYRSCEDILEAVKPLCIEHGLVLIVEDSIVREGDRYYVEASATVYDTDADSEKEAWLNVTAYAREEESRKGMDSSQITGSASSYARKYALNGLFCIDDTKDADTMEPVKKEYKCADCGKPFKEFTDRSGKKWSAGQVYHMSRKNNADGKARCKDCKKKYDEANQ
ncbi:MAG: ERF family protein [Bacillota bacterium]|jgi:DNA-directed RNA polymerase subunit RPC12/RpoP